MSQTKLLIGVDEAGYGPSMGPLTISATAWRVPSSFDAESMTGLLEPEFQAKPFRQNSTHVPIGDSKKIHHGKFAFQGLVIGANFLDFSLNGVTTSDWDSRIQSFAPGDWNRLRKVPWYASHSSVNSSVHSASIDQLIPDQSTYFQRAKRKLEDAQIELVGVRMRILDEMEFNLQVDRLGNKSTLLSECSLALVLAIIRELSNAGEGIEVYCDKHGGRNRYQAILGYAFGELFDPVCESRERSLYTSRFAGHSMMIQFKVDGDSMFPSAAASIVAKCTREVLMERLNGFWQSKVSGVAPTAGYYVDAMRFAEVIEETAAQAGLHRELWWRKK